MSEFKYACPVCGQHMKCDSSQSGTVMECPTCFQKITAPQAPATDDPKFIITGTKMGERPLPAVMANSGAATPPGEKFSGGGIRLRCFVLSQRLRRCLCFTGKFSNPPPGKPTRSHPRRMGSKCLRRPNRLSGWCGSFSPKVTASFEAGSTDAEVKDPAKAAFLADFKADLAAPLAFAEPLPLTTHTGVGREVPTAAGDIRYHESFPGGLVIGVTLSGLVPNHAYVLTLNGAVQQAGNENLPEQLSRNNPQKYYDFSRISTDANGRYQATFGIRLPPGPYDVYFFVKDTANWNIVLGHNLFTFTVE